MKLTAKLISFWIAGVLLVIGFGTYLSIRYDVTMFQEDMRLNAIQRARTLEALIEHVWQTSGEDRALSLIEDANADGRPSTARWVWLDARPGDPRLPKASPEQRRRVRDGFQVTFQERDRSGHGSLYTYVPAKVGASRPGALELAISLDGLNRFRRNVMIRACVVSALLVVGSVIAVAAFGIIVVGRPLNQLIAKTRRVGAGDLSSPLSVAQSDELGELAVAFNQMCEQIAITRNQLYAETDARVATMEQLRHADRLTTVGRLAAGVAHELGTPMNVAAARADLIIEAPSDDVAANAKIIKAQVNKMAAIIRQLLDFARRRSPRKENTDLSSLTDQTVQWLATLARNRNIKIMLSLDENPVTVEVDRSQIQQVLTNLLDNAIQATPNGGTIRVRVDHGSFRPPADGDGRPRRFGRLEVRDEGIGIAKEHLNQIFDPFFTTKDVGEGTGLGLSIAYGIVREHGGWIDVASIVGAGAFFGVLATPQRRAAGHTASRC